MISGDRNQNEPGNAHDLLLEMIVILAIATPAFLILWLYGLSTGQF